MARGNVRGLFLLLVLLQILFLLGVRLALALVRWCKLGGVCRRWLLLIRLESIGVDLALLR